MKRSFSKPALTAVLAIFLSSGAATAMAQNDTNAPAATTEAPAAAPMTKAEKRKELRAQRRAARKEARAKNTAELKKLEGAGYQPAQNDPNYPDKLQRAEQKANQGQ
jgi:uncharacterized membrane protein